MKHLLSTLLLSAVALCASAQQGTWKGNLKVQGITLPLVFHLSEDASTLDSPADFSRFTTADFKDDALAAVSLMRERFVRVGALGHSEGGTIALMLAADGKVDFAASLAGMAVSGMQTLVMQNRQAIAQLGLPANVTEPYCQAVERTLTAISEGRNPTDAELAGVPAQLKTALEQSVKQCSTPYFKHFLKLDIRPSLPSVKCPVLALNGTLDQQVDATSNLAALEKGLTHSALTLKRLDGLNHLFQHCTTGSVVEYQQIEETIAPEVLTTLTEWITALGK